MKNEPPKLHEKTTSAHDLDSGAAKNVEDAFTETNKEMHAAFLEGTKLEQQGQFDKNASAKLEARLDTIMASLDKKIAKSIAEVKEEQPATRSERLELIFVRTVPPFALIGITLLATIGERFIFAFAEQGLSAVPLLFAFLLPTFAIFWFRLECRTHSFAERFPTWFVRWILMFPLIVTLSTAMVIFSPLGWAALAGWAIGTPSTQLDAQLVSIEPMRAPRKIFKCDQKARLRIGEIQSDVCVEDIVSGPIPKPGDAVNITGKASALGFYINGIALEPK
jgi:hypothetical protein